MKTRSLLTSALLLLLPILAACGAQPTQTPFPTETPTVQPTRTATRTATRPATASATPRATTGHPPAATSALTPTPPANWRTYSNLYLGYSFHYPANGSINEQGFSGMDVNEPVPPGFTYDEYFDYVEEVLPGSICVMVSAPGVLISIQPPASIATYALPCVGLGIGDQYRIKDATLLFTVNGREYSSRSGKQLFLEGRSLFQSEIYFIDLENGFMLMFMGRPAEGISMEDYLRQRENGMRILASLHWFRTPDLTKPGATCAGRFTRLMPGVLAQVTEGDPLRVRFEADTAATILTQVYPGTYVLVMEGPVCADGLVFWKVENAGIPGGAGWAAEGDGMEHWLVPDKP